MKGLYPRIKSYAQHQLQMDSRHTLYVEECGNPNGIPVVFLHGGPGGGCEPLHRRFFDPEVYRIILFDQRGCGRSTPHADLTDNTTQHLVEDIEQIRRHFNIRRWMVFGGSWGSTLALVYAQTHPSHVTGLVLRGIFLCREQEISWFYQQGANRIFPDYWQDFVAPVKEAERDKLLLAYHQILTGKNELKRMAAAKAWSIWEGRTATLLPDKHTVEHFADPHIALSMARIECHYFTNNAFLEPNQILNDIAKIADIPGVIVQGRYDLICPLESAWELHQAWPGSELHIIGDAGHAASERGIAAALVEATDRLSRSLA